MLNGQKSKQRITFKGNNDVIEYDIVLFRAVSPVKVDIVLFFYWIGGQLMDWQKVPAIYDTDRTLKYILTLIEKTPNDPVLYSDSLTLIQEHVDHGEKDWMKANKWFRQLIIDEVKALPSEHIKVIEKLNNCYRWSLLINAKEDFDVYALYIEQNRDPKKRFYLPRRKQLYPIVRAMQDLADDKLDLLGISLPPGAGKTTLAIFYLTWLAGKRPDQPKLTGSHSNNFIRGVYDECLRIVERRGEYLWKDVFPDLQVTSTNAKDCRIDFGSRKRFETLEFTSIGTGNAGLYRASDLLYCDDLVSGIEVALSKDRLDKLWETYTTDLRQRKIGDHCKELHIATRWSVHDVLGRLERQYDGNDRARFITVPALNENDESNFDYMFGVGFSTAFYHEQRDIMDDASWRALYMNQPIEREGILYHPDELRRYFKLPDKEPDGIISICDTKDKGKDYEFLPIAYLYGEDIYIEDCICDNGKPEVVEERVANKLVEHHVQMARFESNSAGGHIAVDVEKRVRELGGKTHITTKYSTENKETKIITNSPEVKRRCLFRDETTYKINSDYGRMVNMLTTYTMMGKNPHDDVPDGMAMLMLFVESMTAGKAEVFQRPW